ncbi:MAG TPA: DUF4157 domain-containing protein [Herpetosiphonaceae bacterium]
MSQQTAAVQQKPAAPAPSLPTATGILQRKCACGGTPGPDGECAACRRRRLAASGRSPSQPTPAEAPSAVHDVLRSPGQPLDADTRSFMESRFGHDFGHVRIHTDAQASQSAEDVNALAYAVGRDVVFRAGQYAPQTEAGRHLLAHELAHVVQQRGEQVGVQQALEIGQTDDPGEHEADAAAEAVMRADDEHKRHGGRPISALRPARPAIRMFTPARKIAPKLMRQEAGAAASAPAATAAADAPAALTQSAESPCQERGDRHCCTDRMLQEIGQLRTAAFPIVSNALTRLDQPASVSGPLTEYFHITPDDSARVLAIRSQFEQMQTIMRGTGVTFYCYDACDPACRNNRRSAWSSTSQLEQPSIIAFCGDYTGAVSDNRAYLNQAESEAAPPECSGAGLSQHDALGARNWLRTLIHEYAHVSSAARPSRGGMLAACERGSVNCTSEYYLHNPDRPREAALAVRNPDSYAYFAWAVRRGGSPASAGGAGGQRAGGGISTGLAVGLGIGAAVLIGGIIAAAYLLSRRESE